MIVVTTLPSIKLLNDFIDEITKKTLGEMQNLWSMNSSTKWLPNRNKNPVFVDTGFFIGDFSLNFSLCHQSQPKKIRDHKWQVMWKKHDSIFVADASNRKIGFALVKIFEKCFLCSLEETVELCERKIMKFN